MTWPTINDAYYQEKGKRRRIKITSPTNNWKVNEYTIGRKRG